MATEATAKTQYVPGTNTDIIRRMFLAGESMQVENFVKYFNDDAVYQFSNFPISYGPQGIINSSGTFLEKVAACVHNVENIWEIDSETAVVEMTVTYTRKDGRVHTLPCADTVRIKNGKVQELRIFMDISPVFAD
ncbi:MAG: nuclear transport factor 2 family protein [Bryobacteraceae bacterium]|nr:nuclear transport factor 2 family protein [Bryobacteraceae bacterium]